MIEELDADSVSGVGGKIECQLHPDLIVCGVHEELLQHISAAVNHISFLPAKRTRVVTGGPVIKAEGDASRIIGNGNHLIGDGFTFLATTSPQF